MYTKLIETFQIYKVWDPSREKTLSGVIFQHLFQITTVFYDGECEKLLKTTAYTYMYKNNKSIKYIVQ